MKKNGKKLVGIGMHNGFSKETQVIMEDYSIKKETEKMFYTNESISISNYQKTFKKEDIGFVFENLQDYGLYGISGVYGVLAEPFVVLLNPTQQEIDEAILKVYNKYKEYWVNRLNKDISYYEEVSNFGEKLKEQSELKKKKENI